MFVLVLFFNKKCLSFQVLHLLKGLSVKLKISVITVILFIYIIPGELALMWLIDGLKWLSFLSLFYKKVSRFKINHIVLFNQFCNFCLGIRSTHTAPPAKSLLLQCAPHIYSQGLHFNVLSIAFLYHYSSYSSPSDNWFTFFFPRNISL